MRTTLTLPDDLLDVVRSIARDRRTTVSEVVADLARRGLEGGTGGRTETDERTKLPVVRLGRLVTSADVRSLEDE